MTRARDTVVVGASAGGVEALRALVAGLPPDLPAALVVVLHMPAGGTSSLAAILNRSGPLPARVVRHGEPLRPGTIHVAPPDHHTLVLDNALALSHGPTESGHRPAIDVLFRSAAIALGPRVIGVQLSGTLDDGVAGLVAISARGGKVLVQDPEDALYRGMPDNALRTVRADHVAPASALGAVLAEVVGEQVDAAGAVSPGITERENTIAADVQPDPDPDAYVLGPASGYTCPDCQGSLADIGDTGRYRCRVGHAWTAEALLAAQGSEWERALWVALRVLEEKASLTRKMAEQADQRGSTGVAERYRGKLTETAHAMDTLRKYLGAGVRVADGSV